MQEIQITMRFPVKMYPENNEKHLRMVAMSYLKGKGVKCFEECGKLIIE